MACNDAVELLPLTAKPEQFSIALIAAALRAAADQVAPEPQPLMHSTARAEIQAIRAELLAIAAELQRMPFFLAQAT